MVYKQLKPLTVLEAGKFIRVLTGSVSGEGPFLINGVLKWQKGPIVLASSL
jgi:hypothetical protein